jgi:hypothetical protein
MQDQVKKFFDLLGKENVFFYLCILTALILPNEGIPLVPVNSPFTVTALLSQLVPGFAYNGLVMIFISEEYIPFISMILLTASIIFLPLRIYGLMTFIQNMSISY